jgi:hypothetical protein
MSVLRVDGDDVVLELSTLEKAEGVHGNLRAPTRAVVGVEVLDDVMSAVHGLKAPGTRIPGITAVGTFLGRASRSFAVVHHDRHRGVVVRLDGQFYDQWVVGCDDPEAVAAAIQGASSGG